MKGKKSDLALTAPKKCLASKVINNFLSSYRGPPRRAVAAFWCRPKAEELFRSKELGEALLSVSGHGRSGSVACRVTGPSVI